MENTTTTDIDWESMADLILEGKCVLFLGPEATVNFKDKKNQQTFFTEQLQNFSSEIHSYHKEDGLFVFSKPGAISKVALKVKKFLEDDFSSPMLEKLAQIPFHFIVMLTADKAIESEMIKHNFPFNIDSYDPANQHTPELPTKKTIPLFYHLFGISDNTDSLIISHSRMYKYIKSLVAEFPLPQNIKTALIPGNASNLIFLGVNFDKWYFQLILDIVGVDNKDYDSKALIENAENPLQTVWEQHFNINFIPNKMDEFVDRLHAVFAARNNLRKPVAGKQTPKNYKLPNILRLLNLSFNSTDLVSFCMCYFEEVNDNFGTEQSKQAQINMLLEYVKKQDQYDYLLELMKDQNLVQYEKNAPYYDEQ